MIVEGIMKNGRTYINFRRFGDTIPNNEDRLNLLVTALPLAIKACIQGMGHEEQAELLRTVITHIEKEVFDIDSFKDIYVAEEGKNDNQ